MKFTYQKKEVVCACAFVCVCICVHVVCEGGRDEERDGRTGISRRWL